MHKYELGEFISPSVLILILVICILALGFGTPGVWRGKISAMTDI